MIPAFDAEIRTKRYRVVEIDEGIAYVVDTYGTTTSLTQSIAMFADPNAYDIENCAVLLAMVLNAGHSVGTLYDALTEYKDRQKRDADCPF
jgi:hypothetical protein